MLTDPKQESPAPGRELLPRLCPPAEGGDGLRVQPAQREVQTGPVHPLRGPGSPAEGAGLMPKDRVIEVNGVNIENLRHSERLGITPTESHVTDSISQPMTNGSPQPQTNGKSGLYSSQVFRPDMDSPDTSTQVSAVEEMLRRTSPSPRLNLSSPDTNNQAPVMGERPRREPLEDSSLNLSSTAAEAKEKVLSKRTKKRGRPLWTGARSMRFSEISDFTFYYSAPPPTQFPPPKKTLYPPS
ncbi:hypothetical protein SKAU_G00119070 [Synaphobranchus kaupii]|uniref:PDZ domain-containing protein n=1 Tax=Synaphobranchus kaupii TaxID=118154 RepID=A0A9Q1FNN9_SYNKA|nr:hypothetical protein SKAU_G00119070 [Synaphobranchus kaupii]